MTVRQKFGEEWWELLHRFILSKLWINIVNTVKKDRLKNQIVIPNESSKYSLRIFEELKPKDIKVVFLSQDPYHTLGVYDGLAFSCSNSLHPQPSLQNIITEIENSYPNTKEQNRNDLLYLVKQGVFLVNTALTVISRKPESHLYVWRKFTKYWIKQLCKFNPKIVWILAGKKALAFESCITGEKIIVGHPSPLNTRNPFVGSEVFLRVNKHLKSINKEEIKW